MRLVCLCVPVCAVSVAHLQMSPSLRALSFLDSPEVIKAEELPRGDLCLAASEGTRGKHTKSISFTLFKCSCLIPLDKTAYTSHV